MLRSRARIKSLAFAPRRSSPTASAHSVQHGAHNADLRARSMHTGQMNRPLPRQRNSALWTRTAFQPPVSNGGGMSTASPQPFIRPCPILPHRWHSSVPIAPRFSVTWVALAWPVLFMMLFFTSRFSATVTSISVVEHPWISGPRAVRGRPESSWTGS
jgi:hypothetical protein